MTVGKTEDGNLTFEEEPGRNHTVLAKNQESGIRGIFLSFFYALKEELPLPLPQSSAGYATFFRYD